MLEIYFGLLVTGFLFYVGMFWAVALGKRKILFACFGSGSLLMSCGLVLGALATQYTFKSYAGTWFLSALSWFVFGCILLAFKDFNVLTKEEVLNRLDGGQDLSSGNEFLEGFYTCWDRYNYEDFAYRVVKVYKVDSLLNTIRG